MTESILWIVVALSALSMITSNLGGYAFFLILGLRILARRSRSVEQLMGPFPRQNALIGSLLLGLPILAGTIGIAMFLIGSLACLAPDLIRKLPEGSLYFDSISVSALCTTLIFAPAAEEFLFRGLAFPLFAQRFGARRAILITSFIFAAPHPDPIGAFVFGIVNCLFYLKTASLWIPILLHVMNNTVAIIMTWLGRHEPANAFPSELRPMLWKGLMVMAIGLPGFIHLVRTSWPPGRQVEFRSL